MPSFGYTLELDVDDEGMKLAVEQLGRRGLNASMRRAVLKTARIARKALVDATRGAMHDSPGGYAPYESRNFKIPKIETKLGGVSAGVGYTRSGYADRFRSTGTKPRFRYTTLAKGEGITRAMRRQHAQASFSGIGTIKGFTGIELGLGMVQIAKMASDPVFPAIADAELQAELVKYDLA